VIGVTSKTADCSTDTAFGGGWLVWPGCCARAAIGHAAAAAPSSVAKNFRRSMQLAM